MNPRDPHCDLCGKPISRTVIGRCMSCLSDESVHKWQSIIDDWLAGHPMKDIAAKHDISRNHMNMGLARLIAVGHPIPRRLPAGKGWRDPLPDKKIVVKNGDMYRGNLILAQKADENRRKRREARAA